LRELAGRGIARVVFERQHPDLDARDRTMIAALQRQQSLPAALRAAWQRALRALLYRRQTRLHWRSESSKRRSQLVAAVCELRHTGAIVIASGDR
jgi:hypothetical protein